MNRRQFLSTLAAAPLARAADNKPNVIVILADDLGWGDIGCYGSDLPTPNIDSIAKNGTRFTDAHVSCPYCSPTRAGLMTGRYQTHFGHEFNPGPAEQAVDNFGLPLTETAMPARFKALGYRTGMFGKWHLGYREEYRPMRRGFDEFFGFLGGAHSYIDANADSANPIYRGNTKVDKVDYTTDEFTREAVSFIERNKDNPFFVYLPYNAVHAPMQALDKYTARFPKINDPQRRIYAGMTAALDDGVGQVLKTLDRHKLTNKTLVVFLTDNGGPTPGNTSRNGPLRGYKAQVWEGGLRVPFIMQWPGHIPKGKTFNHPVIALDVLPTVIAAAGAKPDASWKLDGVNLLPHMQAKSKAAPHAQLFWRFGRQWAMREGDWKLLSMGEAPMLFNLAKDIGEKNDLSTLEKDRLRTMSAAWEEWNKKNIAPLWTPRAADGQKKKKKKKKQA